MDFFPTQITTFSITVSLSWLSHLILQFFLSRHGCVFFDLFLEFLCRSHDLISLTPISIAKQLSYSIFHSFLIHLHSPSNMKTFCPSHQNPTLHSPLQFPLSSPRFIQRWLQSVRLFLSSSDSSIYLPLVSSVGAALYRL